MQYSRTVNPIYHIGNPNQKWAQNFTNMEPGSESEQLTWIGARIILLTEDNWKPLQCVKWICSSEHLSAEMKHKWNVWKWLRRRLLSMVGPILAGVIQSYDCIPFVFGACIRDRKVMNCCTPFSSLRLWHHYMCYKNIIIFFPFDSQVSK